MAGKKDAAAKPKARATTAATKPGGFIPKYPAIHTAKKAEFLQQLIHLFRLFQGNIPF